MIEWTFHIFSNNCDHYTQDIHDALKMFYRWKKDNLCARLYLQIEIDEELQEENCLLSYGDFPV